LTNNIPSSSTSQNIPFKKHYKPAQLHFASFYYDVLSKYRDLDFQIPEEWKFTMAEIKNKSILSDGEFTEFLIHFEVDFSPINIYKEPDTRAEKIKNKHIKEIASYIFDKIKNAKGTVEITSAKLIKEIGWEDKITLKNPHEFPVDKSKYIPIKSTIRELLGKLNSLEKGYLALVGAPGTGKSTLLSELNSNLEFKSRIIRYYAFVPDSNKILLRGEMNNFLFDLIKLLELEGFVASIISEPDNTDQLFEKLNSVFEQIGSEYSKTGKKTIIIIDGLDHIEREEKPTRSFLSILPSIDKIPKGLIFLLGSQKVELNDLNYNIKKSLENGGIININPFSLSEVTEFLNQSGLNLNPAIISEIARVSEGHPTLLGIIVKNIQEQPTNDIFEILSTYKVYNGNLDYIYDQLWDQIKHEGVKNILGILARLRREVDIQLIAQKTQQFKEIQELNDKFKHLFNVKGNYWSFYHNSFRLYLENKTAQYLSQYNQENHKKSHK